MEQKLDDFLETFARSETLTILRNPKYSSSLSKNKDTKGNHFFRIRDGQNTIARSRNFKNATDRNDLLKQFVDWVEVELHNNFQRRFDF